MESVIDTAIGFVTSQISELLDNLQKLDELSNEIEYLKREQQRIQSSLRDADARRYKENTTQESLGIFRSLSYRIQDLLESYSMEVERREGKGMMKFFRSIRRMIEDPSALRNLKREIRYIKYIIGYFRLDDCSITNVENEDKQRLIQTGTNVQTKDFVGMKEGIDSLALHMVDEDTNCPFIFICGMFGSGKTALAREIYNHPVIRVHFEGFAWIDLGKRVERRSILRDILRQLLPEGKKEEIMEMEDMGFTQLYHIQQKRKCLIVLDGIESIDTWEVVRVAFSSVGLTSKILVTTRMREVAETVAGNGHIHTISCLTEDEGWELLKRKVAARTAQDDLKDLEEIGKGIVRRYKGLPLAVEIIFNFIATNYSSVEEWTKLLYHNMDSVLVAGESGILASAFNDLPYHLKPCFLYLSYFPEDSTIEVEKLYLFWMAEDMIASEDRYNRKEENRMEIAEKYLKELQQRGLVDVKEEEELPTFRRFRSCHLHGLMRELCLSKGKEEEFVEVIDFRSTNQEGRNLGPVRRLIIYLGSNNIKRFPNFFIGFTTTYLRCLLIYMDEENLQRSVFPQDLENLSCFKVLRVLDFNGVNFLGMMLPRGISKLKRLRYLSFEHCQLEALPENIGSLPYLQVLDLRVKNKMILPNILWKLKKLRHLYLPETFQTSSPGKLQLGSLKDLETLKHFDTKLCNVEDLVGLTKLRYLTCSVIEGSLKDLDWIVKRMSMVSEDVLFCSIDVRDFDCYTEERHSIFRQILGGRALHSFSIKGYLGEMPSCHAISQHLAEIVLSGSELKKDAMLTLEKLPSLRVLVLDEDAFAGVEMVCSAEGFYQLRRFQLSYLRDLRKLTIANEAFPMLSAFTIQNCDALLIKKMPDRLEKLLHRTSGR